MFRSLVLVLALFFIASIRSDMGWRLVNLVAFASPTYCT